MDQKETLYVWVMYVVFEFFANRQENDFVSEYLEVVVIFCFKANYIRDVRLSSHQMTTQRPATRMHNLKNARPMEMLIAIGYLYSIFTF